MLLLPYYSLCCSPELLGWLPMRLALLASRLARAPTNHGRARVLSRPELRALPSLSVFVEPDSTGPVEPATSWKVACGKYVTHQ